MDKLVLFLFGCVVTGYFLFVAYLYLFKPDEAWEFQKKYYLKGRYYRDDVFEKPYNWGRDAFLGGINFGLAGLLFLIMTIGMFMTILTTG